MSNVDINVDRRTDGRTDGRTENRTPMSHPATSRCDKNGIGWLLIDSPSYFNTQLHKKQHLVKKESMECVQKSRT